MSSSSDTDVELEGIVCSILLDPRVRDQVKAYIEPWMFSRDCHRAFAMSLMNSQFDMKVPQTNVLTLTIKSKNPNLNKSDWEEILRIVNSFKPVNDEDLDHVVNIISMFIKDCLMLRGADEVAKGNMESAERYFTRGQGFSISTSNFYDLMNPETVDMLRALDMPEGGQIIKSSLSLVNSNSLYKGYKYGDLSMICMAPKRGKSTLMVQEGAAAADQGFKVAHIWLGDMTAFDGYCKYASCYTGDSMYRVLSNYKPYAKRCEKIFDNIRVAAFPAMSRTVQELLSEANSLKQKFDFDVLIIDYDANIIPPKDGMYESGGVMYSLLKSFAQSEGCVCHVGCQPKMNYWDLEVLPGEAASESSRKQHAIDYMITGGWNQKAPRRVGSIHIPMMRRGQSMVTARVKFDYEKNKITEISQETYNKEIYQAQMEIKQSEEAGSSDITMPAFGDPVEESQKRKAS